MKEPLGHEFIAQEPLKSIMGFLGSSGEEATLFRCKLQGGIGEGPR